MTALGIAAIIILVILLFAVFSVVGVYNRLVSKRQRYKNSFAQIDVQLKRRYDLIPNLIETAKKYMSHERDTLEAVINARNQAASAQASASSNPGDGSAIKNLVGAEAALSGSLGRLFALSENYPDLKSNQNMMQLTEELTSTENKIAFARQSFNDAATTYNTARETFPSALFANSFGFQEAGLFEIEDKAEKDPIKVSFD